MPPTDFNIPLDGKWEGELVCAIVFTAFSKGFFAAKLAYAVARSANPFINSQLPKDNGGVKAMIGITVIESTFENMLIPV